MQIKPRSIILKDLTMLIEVERNGKLYHIGLNGLSGLKRNDIVHLARARTFTIKEMVLNDQGWVELRNDMGHPEILFSPAQIEYIDMD